jgi:small conductance mechanosensitive channel
VTIDEAKQLSEHKAMHKTPAILKGLLVVSALLGWAVSRSAEAPPPNITRAQATELLDTLNDPTKREQFTATLAAYVAALPPGGTASGAAVSAAAASVPVAAAAPASPPGSTTRAAAPPAAPKPHAPSLLKKVFARVQSAGAQWALDLRSVTDFPALSAWLGSRLEGQAQRNAFSEAGLRLALIFLFTVGVDALLHWLFSRHLAPTPAGRTPGLEASRLRHTLRRLLARFGPIVVAALAGNAALVFVADFPVARTLAFGAVNTYLAVRLVLALLDEYLRAEAATPAVGDLTPIAAAATTTAVPATPTTGPNTGPNTGPTTGPATGPAAATAGAAARRLPPGLRPLLVALVIVVALQLLSGDLAEDLGAPEAILQALAKCIALVAHLLAIMIVLVSRKPVSRWIRGLGGPATYWGAVTEALAAIWPTVAVCAIAGSWIVWALDIPDAYREIVRVMVATVAVLLLSRFVGNLLLKGLDRRIAGWASAASGSFDARLFGYRRAVRAVLQILLIGATLLALTEAWGLPSIAWLGTGHPGHRFAALAAQMLVLAIIGIVCWEAADLAFERRVARLTDATSRSRATRLRTLQPIIRFALLVLIGLLVVMTALDAIGINVGPLLAGAGIFGVALGFGSQKLVQDFITGIFLLVEDAMDVGDWVTLAGVSGTVEHISIRSIRLRGGDGSVYLIPFSSVTSVNNTNRGLGNASVSVNVDPSEDTDRISTLLAEIAREMRKEPEFAAGMQSDLQLWGVDKVDGSMITIAGQIVCTDAGRWGVQREFNRRMKLRFEHERIRLAVPKQSLSIRRGS